jgi:hypothetical protein
MLLRFEADLLCAVENSRVSGKGKGLRRAFTDSASAGMTASRSSFHIKEGSERRPLRRASDRPMDTEGLHLGNDIEKWRSLMRVKISRDCQQL